jgi:hypothetical protein
MKLIMTVECDLPKRDICDLDTVVEDLLHECVKVKSGVYENVFYGDIAKVEIVQPKTSTRKYRGN